MCSAHTYCFNGIFQNTFALVMEKEVLLMLPKAGVKLT